MLHFECNFQGEIGPDGIPGVHGEDGDRGNDLDRCHQTIKQIFSSIFHLYLKVKWVMSEKKESE